MCPKYFTIPIKLSLSYTIIKHCTHSILCLELKGARVINLQSVSNVFDLQKEQMNFWTDSMNVLWWIRGCSKDFKPFLLTELEKFSCVLVQLNEDMCQQS